MEQSDREDKINEAARRLAAVLGTTILTIQLAFRELEKAFEHAGKSMIDANKLRRMFQVRQTEKQRTKSQIQRILR